MESVKPMEVATGKGKFRRAFAKILHIQTLMGVAPEYESEITKKIQENMKFDQEFSKNANDNDNNLSASFDRLEEEYEKRLNLEALLANLFATIASLKAAYVRLQYAQSPYDPESIHKADNFIVSELKTLSELKRCFLKKQFDPCPEKTLVLAEIQELNSLLKTYDIMGKKLESQLKLKDSEIMFLKEKLEEHIKQNKSMTKSSRLCNPLDNLHLSGINPTHFVTYLHRTVKSIRGFVRLMAEEMKLSEWDIDTAADSIQPGVSYYRTDHKCFAFEHFVCKVMFEAFHLPYFSASSESSYKKKKNIRDTREVFFERFNELKSTATKDYLSSRPKSRFARFCRDKYLKLIHPRMEIAFFGNTNLRNQVIAGEFPEMGFVATFLEMAKRVWLLHCLALSFEPQASIFQVSKGCRFSEVYMKSVAEEVFFSPECEPRVAFMVVPGFSICKTLIQCEVYLSHS